MNDYHNELSVTVPKNVAFRALTHEMSQWWTDMSADFNGIGDKSTATFDDGTTWTFEVITFIQNERLELKCIQANHIHPVTTDAMRTEWQGTVLRFDLQSRSDKTHVQFTHIGLVPNFHCYDICHAGWDHFFGKAFLEHLKAKQT